MDVKVLAPLETGNVSVSPGDSRRICTPEETFRKVIKFAPVMGITRVANITGLDTLNIPVYVAYRPNARSISVAQGKGRTSAAAKASALMEAVETWHAETIDLPLRLNSFIELRSKYDIADISKLPKIKDHLFTSQARIPWIEGDDLFSGRKKLVPYEMVHLDYRIPLPCGHGCFIPSSTGLASGNHMLEAIIHGICEVVERDALTLWCLKSPAAQKLDKIDLDTITDPRCLDIMNRFHSADVNVGVWEIMNDTRIPAFLCRLLPKSDTGAYSIRPSSGMGCHLLRDIALLRALTEAAQSRLGFISGARDDLSREGYKKFLTPEEHNRWRESISERSALKDFRSVVSLETPDLNADLDLLLERLRRAGISEIITVDLTKPEFKIPVVRVIIPGMEGKLMKTETLLGQRAGRILSQEKTP